MKISGVQHFRPVPPARTFAISVRKTHVTVHWMSCAIYKHLISLVPHEQVRDDTNAQKRGKGEWWRLTAV